MGDAGYDLQQLSRESFRLDTYDANALQNVKNQLAKAGFYYTRSGLKVKCFACSYELDASEINASVDIIKLHKEKQPGCRFAKTLNPSSNARSKKFLSYDSLRYEKERLETFIEWPIPWLSPDDLAADGFYYLRTNDHCACVFCRGIVGAWELGDTPRGEHQRHFPHCPFIRGQPVGNVPMTQSSILDKLPLDGEECPLPPPRCEYTIDEAGAGAGPVAGPVAGPTSTTSGRHMPGSYAECKVPEKRSNINYDDIGLRQYTGPKRKDYITKDSRVKSYSRWPERVVQKPDEMAEAGFFYCGLSDHVRCFHCGSGLRNWEIEDLPWEEHARWYPDCNFVLLSKGQEFIDKVRRERPPYLRNAAAKPQKVAASSGQFKPIGDKDLEPLMNLDIIQAIGGMGFPAATIRKALRRKLEQTGLPFFSLEPCIEAVLQVMEEETRQTLQEPTDTDVEDEAVARQNDKMQKLHLDYETSSTNATQTSNGAAGPSQGAAGPSQGAAGPSPGAAGPSQGGGAAVKSVPPNVRTIQSSASATAQETTASTSTIARASTSSTIPETSTVNAVPVVSQEINVHSSSQAEAMEVDEPTEAMEIQTSADVPAQPEANESQTSGLAQPVVAMREADERISLADEALKPGHSGPPSLEMKVENKQVAAESLEGQTSSGDKKTSVSATQRTQKEIADELERIRESRTCKICMDAEMDVVFLPCTHMATCSSCAVTMATCPICRVDIKYTIKPIFS